MVNPFSFFGESLKKGFKIIPESHYINHASYILSNPPIYLDFGIETRYIKKIVKEMAAVYARLINQYKCKNHILISASFYKNIEEDERCEEIEFNNILNIEHKLTESDIKNIYVESQLEHQIQIHETKESGWKFDKSNSMRVKF